MSDLFCHDAIAGVYNSCDELCTASGTCLVVLGHGARL